MAEAIVAWRPWQMEQLEAIEATDFSTPRRRHFSRGYLMLVALHAGTSTNEYRNSRTSEQGRVGLFRVFESEEIWNCQSQGLTFSGLTVEPRWLQEFAERTLHREQSVPHFPNRSLFDPSLTAALCNLAAASTKPASRLQQEELLISVFSPLLLCHGEKGREFARPGMAHPAARRAKDYLQAHYAEEVSLQALAEVADLSPFHLARVFRNAVGLPPHAYQTQLRLAHARKLLGQGFDVGYVAQLLGFFDQSHFAQHFRRNFYLKPSSYGKMARSAG